MSARGVEAHAVLKARAPHLAWDPKLVVQCAADFPDLDVVAVAAHCALYCVQKPEVRNGPRTFRTFLEKEQERHTVTQLTAKRAELLAPYHRPRNSR